MGAEKSSGGLPYARRTFKSADRKRLYVRGPQRATRKRALEDARQLLAAKSYGAALAVKADLRAERRAVTREHDVLLVRAV